MGAQPRRQEATVGFEGEFEVPDTGEDSAVVTTVIGDGVRGQVLTSTSVPRIWAVLIQASHQPLWVSTEQGDGFRPCPAARGPRAAVDKE